MTLFCKRESFIFELNDCDDHYHLGGVGLFDATIVNGKCEELGEDFDLVDRRSILGIDVYWFNYTRSQPVFFSIGVVEKYIEAKINAWNRIKAGKEAAERFMATLEKVQDEDDEGEYDLDQTLSLLEKECSENAHATFRLQHDLEYQKGLCAAHTERLDGHFGHIKMLNKEIEGLNERLEKLEKARIRPTRKPV